ncbi:DNA segregation ATPase FtsK/SpoIIIE, S-DNA-T family [Serratia symbiotica str. 'Cinara cedri']|nr:DNA segregation ATPase FtsK/SpoIIIE, S-DNA-T family [Serratia symbiotica str. 'Cinara cedri']
MIKLITTILIDIVIALRRHFRIIYVSSKHLEIFFNQGYTEEKKVINLKKLNISQFLLDVILIIIAIFAVYLMVVLISFNPSDPSWSQTSWHKSIHNIGGRIGAWVADMLLFIFGMVAYVIPLIILLLCWVLYRQQCYSSDYIDYLMCSLRLFGTVIIICACCVIAELNIDDFYHFISGGVLGYLLSSLMLLQFGSIGTTLISLCIWIVGVRLFTGLSWLIIAEKIGSVVLRATTFIIHYTFRSKYNYNDNSRNTCHDSELSELK